MMRELIKMIIKKYIRLNLLRKDILLCPLAFAEIGVKGRVKSVLKYKKPAFWIIIVGLIACAAVSVFFLSNPKNNSEDNVKYYAFGKHEKITYDEFATVYREELLKYEDYHNAMESANNILMDDGDYEIVNQQFMRESFFRIGLNIYYHKPTTSFTPYNEKLYIRAGSLYRARDGALLGLLMPIDLTKENFEDLVSKEKPTYETQKDRILYPDANAALVNIRESCKNAWLASGDNGSYVLLEGDKVFYLASCELDEQGNIVSYNYIARLEDGNSEDKDKTLWGYL